MNDPATQQPRNGGSRPVPDPTSLTTQQLEKAIESLRELLEAKISGAVAIRDAEFDNIRTFYNTILTERDHRYDERHQAAQTAIYAALSSSETAVSAAFEAAERAISKAEVSIEKRADATYVQLAELTRMLGALMPRVESEQRFNDTTERVSVLASRIDRMEAKQIGGREDRTGLYATIGVGATLIFLVIAVIGFLATRVSR